jgi:hypothetical protein
VVAQLVEALGYRSEGLLMPRFVSRRQCVPLGTAFPFYGKHTQC